MSTYTFKELTHNPGGIRLRLIQTFDGNNPSGYAVETVTGMLLPPSNPLANKVQREVFGTDPTQYSAAAKRFKELAVDLL